MQRKHEVKHTWNSGPEVRGMNGWLGDWGVNRVGMVAGGLGRHTYTHTHTHTHTKGKGRGVGAGGGVGGGGRKIEQCSIDLIHTTGDIIMTTKTVVT